MSIASLGIREVGNRLHIVTDFISPAEPPAERTSVSQAVTFEWIRPDGLKEIASSPSPDITGPTAMPDVTVDGVVLKKTRWVWKTPLLTRAGTYSVRSSSRAPTVTVPPGIEASHQANIEVPAFAPFDTALVAPPLTAGSFPASLVSIDDPGNYYTATESNGAFQEIAATTVTIGEVAFEANFGTTFSGVAAASAQIAIAMFPLQIVAAEFSPWQNGITASDTNWWSIELRKFNTATGVTGTNFAVKNTKVTGGAAMLQRQSWTYDAVTFDPTHSVFVKGDCIGVSCFPTGAPLGLNGLGCTLRYRPL
jgi:hypothetical protein